MLTKLGGGVDEHRTSTKRKKCEKIYKNKKYQTEGTNKSNEQLNCKVHWRIQYQTGWSRRENQQIEDKALELTQTERKKKKSEDKSRDL